MRNLCDLGAGLLGGAAVSDGTFRIQARGQNVYPMTLLGTFSPYMVVHRSSVVKIDPSIPLDRAALLGCGVLTGTGAVLHTANVEPGSTVAVIGCGGIGLNCVQAAALVGALRVIAIDRVTSKLDLAKQFGATDVIDASATDPVEWKRDQALKFGATHVYPDVNAALMGMAEVTYGLMAHKVVVTVGELHGADVDSYLNITQKGGTCVLTAIGSLLDTNVTLNLAMLTLMQKNLQGTIFGGGNPQYDIPQLLSMYKAGKLNLDDMITRQYRLEQINDGYQDMLDGKNIRGVIRYTDADR